MFIPKYSLVRAILENVLCLIRSDIICILFSFSSFYRWPSKGNYQQPLKYIALKFLNALTFLLELPNDAKFDI